MELKIRVDGEHEVLASLYQWLSEDSALSDAVELSTAADPEPGTQGVGLDLILAVVNSTTGVAGLAVSYATWRDAHRRREPVTFEGEGRTIRVLDGSDSTTQAIVEAFPDPRADVSGQEPPSSQEN
jgi:Effector Associated Constant Component 1